MSIHSDNRQSSSPTVSVHIAILLQYINHEQKSDNLTLRILPKSLLKVSSLVFMVQTEYAICTILPSLNRPGEATSSPRTNFPIASSWMFDHLCSRHYYAKGLSWKTDLENVIFRWDVFYRSSLISTVLLNKKNSLVWCNPQRVRHAMS